VRPSLFSFLLSLLLAGVAPAADSLHVRLVGFYADSSGTGSGDVCGDYAYYLGPDSDFTVLSVADPAHPVPVGQYDWAEEVNRVVAVGDLVYAAHSIVHLLSG